MKYVALVAAVLLLVVGITPAAAQDAQTPDGICAAATPVEPDTREFTEAEQVLEPGIDYRAVICTEMGSIYVDLFEQTAPLTVNNFVFLAQNHFYDNSIFHRVIADFMAQAGDPVGNPPGTGGPGYEFADEFVSYLNFDRPGLLAMANANQPEAGILGTNGSQFFITTVVTDWLNQRHTIFGEVLEGQEVVDSLPDNQTDTSIQTKLNTVVIITDPNSVVTDFEFATPATAEEIEATIAEIPTIAPTLLGEGIVAGENNGMVSTEERIAAAPEAAQLSLQSFFENHPAESHAIAELVNETCDLVSLPIADMSYWMDVYPTAEAAAEAFADTAQLDTIAADMGLAPVESEHAAQTVYSGTVSACDNDALVRALSFRQIGRFVVTSVVTFDPVNLGASGVTEADASALLLNNLNDPAFGMILSDVFRPEVQ